MPRKDYQRFISRFNGPYLAETFSQRSESSNFRGGVLVLKANAYDRVFDKVMKSWERPANPPPGAENLGIRVWNFEPAGNRQRLPPGFSFSTLDSQVYSKFHGKLRKGGASLGVTIGSWQKSRDMIVQRSRHLVRTLDSTISYLDGNKKAVARIRRERQPLANQVLETEFGWRPLFSDLHSALFTVAKDSVPPEWITSRARSVIYKSEASSTANPCYRRSWDGVAKVTYSAKVQISNPNVWMLNRLGLINPAVVAWDLIPWSFVVNMFVNANNLIKSVSDEVGLNVTDRSITRTSLIGFEELLYSNGGYPGPAFSRVLNKVKRRDLGHSPKLSVEYKVPELNWELAIIASSLVVQKFKTINRIIGIL